MSIKVKLLDHFRKQSAAPFLFIGSGFSRRYLGTEDWASLLRRFASGLRPFEYYLSTADGYLPKVAALIAEDFHGYWWEDEKYKDHREKYKNRMQDKTSALRIEICEHLKQLSELGIANEKYKDEIDVLCKLNIDGIITTNWDTFLEEIFPEYRVFTGQSELIFSNPQSISEIYKIHGSIRKPHSLVLTEKDYEEFNKRNSYLAAKLITLFVEHPIVFIGYSLTDSNIISVLKSIVVCLGGERLEQLARNLIFVQWSENESDSMLYATTFITIDAIQLPITLIKSSSFLPIYQALYETRRKIPIRILRYMKEQLYELVKSTDPNEKMFVVDVDNINKKDDIEFVVGVGVINDYNISNKGYVGCTANDLYQDVIFGGQSLDPHSVLSVTIPVLAKSKKNLPVFKYLRHLDVCDHNVYLNSGYELDKFVI